MHSHEIVFYDNIDIRTYCIAICVNKCNQNYIIKLRKALKNNNYNIKIIVLKTTGINNLLQKI